MPLAVRWILACAAGGALWGVGTDAARLVGLLAFGIPLAIAVPRRMVRLAVGTAAVMLAAMILTVVLAFAGIVVLFNTDLGDTGDWVLVGWVAVCALFAVGGLVLGAGLGALVRARTRWPWAVAGALAGAPAGLLLGVTVDSPRPTAAAAGLAAGVVFGAVTAVPLRGTPGLPH